MRGKLVEEHYDIVNPGAAAMIESLRAYGYTLNTAIADLIDNSISAGAKHVWVHMFWAGESSWISIIDDGHGMSEETLKNAMRPGSTNPLDDRPPSDLGRFGLGLKTASFSQCRSLTVATKESNEVRSVRRWDLDYVGKHNEWRLLKTPRSESYDRLEYLDSIDHGTVVLLEDLDHLCKGQVAEDVSHRRKFFARIDSLQRHLSMVFHRYMEGSAGIRFFINGHGDDNLLEAWDPFLQNNSATRPQPEERKQFGESVVVVKGYVLPHKDKLSTDEHELAGGLGGWNDQQGFYVYRNKRLLVPGSWLGLGGRRHGWTKEEHYKLARIKVDIPNSMDSAWQIDVKKSTAVPPPLISGWLEKYAGNVRKEARDVFSHRGKHGKRPQSQEIVRLWKSGTRNGSQVYKIDRQNQLIKQLLAKSGQLKPDLESLLKLLEETVPVQQIWLDMAEHAERQNEPMGGLAESEVLKLVEQTLTTLVGSGRRPSQSDIDYVCSLEGLDAYEDLIRAKYQGETNEQ